LRLSVNDLDRSGEQPAMRKGTLVGNTCISDITTPGAIRLVGQFEDQSMKYDDELSLLLLAVFVIIGGALLLALLF